MSDRIFQRIPSVNELLESPALKGLVERVSHHVVVGEVRSFLDNLRHEIRARAGELQVPHAGELAERIAQWIAREERPLLRPVINATGIILHTGLGRAPLARTAVDALVSVASNYCTLEVDAESGERTQRLACVERLLTELSGSEAALVVNNCAAATVLALAALATGRDVIVSRGELIEIGGSYRLPDVMAASGARLREVGTTNRTRVADYRQACGDETAALLKVHSSNYRIVGFCESASLADLVALGHQRQLPVLHDVGSGAFLNLARFGMADEPQVRVSIQTGADLVLCSGDKLLGGPQCGIVVGRRRLIQPLLQHPLMRAFRVDKLTLAALHATLGLLRSPERAEQEIPILSLISTSLENLRHRAERLAPQLAACDAVSEAQATPGEAHLGGGSTPEMPLPTWCIALAPAQMRLDQFARRLRIGSPAVFGRVQHDRIWLDLRTVFPRQDTELVRAVKQLSEVADTGESDPDDGPEERP